MKVQRMDRATAKYICDNFYNLVDEGFEMCHCSECDSDYLEEVGHEHGDYIEVEVHEIEESDVVEPIRIIPPSYDEERETVLNDIFGALKD